MITFTVFTPTFNRAHLLPLVYRSLCAQNFKNFEWLIVDDGSTDSTKTIVSEWIQEQQIAIRYFRQSNQGKHVAFNYGIMQAAGELFLPLDSDDVCVSNALLRLYESWTRIPAIERENYSGVTCLCKNTKGDVLGGYFPADIFDSDSLNVMFRLGISGDKWGFHRTDILRENLFPVIQGEKFIVEGIVWNRIAARFKMRFVNEPLLIAGYFSDGLSRSSVKLRANNPNGACLYYCEFSQLPIPIYQRAKAMVNYWRFHPHRKGTIKQGVADMGVISLLLRPIGIAYFLRDRAKLKGN